MRLFGRIVLWTLGVILVVIGTLFVIGIAYEKEVIGYMKERLGSQLNATFYCAEDNIDFSLFKNFPLASIDCHQPVMMESPVSNSTGKKGRKIFLKPDTLFAVEDLSLQFNLIDILKKNYVVKQVSASNGIVKLRMGKDGVGNWNIWKEDTLTTSSHDEPAFNLEQFKLKNVGLRYFDNQSKDDLACLIEKASISGAFKSAEYEMSITGDLKAHRFFIDSVNYLDQKPVKLDLNLHVDNGRDLYKFSDAIVQIADLKIRVEGQYTSNSGSPDQIDISLKGKDMDVQSVLSLLPEKYHQDIRDYESEGEFYGTARISGKMDEENSPEVKADFGIKNANITQLSSGISLKGVTVAGDYFASSTSSKYFLDLRSFSASLANGRVAGSIRIDNFSAPNVTASVTADLLLEDIRHLLKVDTIWNYPVESFAGVVKANMKYQGRMNTSGKYTRSDFEKMSLAGDLRLENAGMKIKNSALVFDSINGSFALNDNSITVSSFSGNTPKSDFYLKGTLKNILAYSFSDDADINVEAVFQSNNFELDEFLVNQEETSKRDTVYNVHFSPRINFTFNSDIGRLTFRRFEASNIKGTFRLRNQKLIGDPLTFNTMDGSITASGMVDGASDSILLVTCNAELKKLNINKLFYQFEDFGQATMTSSNLKGIGTATVQFASVWSSDLNVDLSRMYARSDLTIEKGQLIKFEPMKALSKYIAVSELEDIKFATLKNQIEIKDQKIYIPRMDISSSALDVSLSGVHTFDNGIDYHIKVLMSDILFQKARNAKKENTEFGVVEDDKSGKTSLFISMTGTVDEPVIKYDKQGAKQNLKENIAEEKHTLKQILRDEFGWFKKDTTLGKKNKPRDDGKFIIKWEDDLPDGKAGEKEKAKPEDDDF